MKRKLSKLQRAIGRSRRKIGVRKIEKILKRIKGEDDSYLSIFSEAPNFGTLHISASGDVEELTKAISIVMCEHKAFRDSMYMVVLHHLEAEESKKEKGDDDER